VRVLVLEDNQRVSTAIAKGLTQERYAVDVVADGNEAFDMAMTEPYDVLIFDIMVPGKDGVTLSKELRKEGVTTPILMLTALGEVEQRVDGLDAGADDYLPKPFAFEELVARVRALSRRPPLQHGEVLRVGSVELNKVAGSVKRMGKLISLSQKEFALLECLMLHPNQVMSKEQLLGKAWNFDTDVLPNTVEATIKNLRKKLDKPFPSEKPMVETVRGFGYRIYSKSLG
jgi:DNA-binding response OmpR family regulator